MAVDYQQLVLPYVPPARCGDVPGTRRPVIVVGAGPVGLTLAIDIARYGTTVLLLDDDDRLSSGSRAICFAKRTLEIWDRLGCGDGIADKGVSWKVGKVHVGERLVYSFDLLPEAGHRRPAFVNLQQYYVEGLLYDHARMQPNLEMRFKHKVVAVDASDAGARVTVETPDGRYDVLCDYVVACDGSRSPVRDMLGLASRGQTFRDRFLIADIRMEADLPIERRFWFDPPFHPHGSALMHRQPDNVWRIDFQLGWDADPAAEREPERVKQRLRSNARRRTRSSTSIWCSVYTFSCVRMEHFRHGRVIFAGDAAHGVSPFGARGANSGVQDADNLAWKLHYVVRGEAPDGLLDTYASEREQAADENIAHSSRSADFLTPKSEISRVFRDAVLGLAEAHPFARRLVNSGPALDGDDARRLAARHAGSRFVRRRDGARCRRGGRARDGRRQARLVPAPCRWPLCRAAFRRSRHPEDSTGARRFRAAAWASVRYVAADRPVARCRAVVGFRARQRRAHRHRRHARGALRRATRHDIPAAS